MSRIYVDDERGSVHEDCGNCHYAELADVGDLDEPLGPVRMECHRYPPQLVGNSQDAGQSWPVMRADDWCGEWRQQPGDDDPPPPEVPER